MLMSPLQALDREVMSSPLLGLHPLSLSGRSVLLATDGSPAALAGARIAQALASKHGADVHVVSVVDTRSAPIPPPLDLALGLADAVTEQTIHATQIEAVRASLSGAVGVSVAWPVRIALGTPALVISREAHLVGAALIIVGLRRHGRLDRAVHDETALTVMRTAPCPVLGVVAELGELPRRLLVGMDFGETSLVAAQAASSLAAAHATLLLAYVQPNGRFVSGDGEGLVHSLGVRTAFTQIAGDLRRQGLVIDQAVLHDGVARSPAEALLDYADAAGVDLIAAGSVRRRGLDRWLMGSVSTTLVREGRRSVLIVPPIEPR